MKVLGATARLALCVLAFAVGMGVSTAAATTQIDQEGRRSLKTDVDGGSVYIEGNSFYAPNLMCVVYAHIIATPVDHLEAGLLRCNNHQITQNCTDGRFIIEKSGPGVYDCIEAGTFQNDTLYSTYTQRNGTGSTTMTAHIGNDSDDRAGFGLTETTTTTTWGEVVGPNNLCPNTAASGSFTLWQKYRFDSGYTTVSNSNQHHYVVDIPSAPCWSIGSVSQTGGYDVY